MAGVRLMAGPMGWRANDPEPAWGRWLCLLLPAQRRYTADQRQKEEDRNGRTLVSHRTSPFLLRAACLSHPYTVSDKQPRLSLTRFAKGAGRQHDVAHCNLAISVQIEARGADSLPVVGHRHDIGDVDQAIAAEVADQCTLPKAA